MSSWGASMSDWLEATISQVATRVTKGTTPPSTDFAAAGVRYIKVESIGNDGTIDRGRLAFVNEDAHRHALKRSILQKDDVLFTIAGTIGRASIVEASLLPANTNQAVAIVRPNRALVLPRFLYYALRDSERVRSAVSRTVQSVQSNLSLAELGALPFSLPPLPEQQAIAEVLGALDDKIAANTAIAATADELFRAEYAALVADLVRVGEVAESPRSGVDPSSVDLDDLYVGLEHLGRRHMWLTDGGRAEDVSSTKSRFEPGDILFGKLRPYFHKVVGAPRSGICSTDILVVRSRDEGLSSVLLAALSSDAVIEEVVAASEGTRMPRTSWKDLAAVEIRWPTSESAPRLASRLDSIRAAALAVLTENRTLAATRDALLPHLVSGKLRVRHAEAAASQAGL